MGNHIDGNCNTDLYDYNLNGNSQYMNVKQGTSLYPANLANTNGLHFTASQSFTEQFGSVQPHLNPPIWDKVNNNLITMGTEVYC